MSIFETDEKGNLVTEQSLIDHLNNGRVPKCPACSNQFRKVGEDRVDGELAGTNFICIYCSKKLFVLND